MLRRQDGIWRIQGRDKDGQRRHNLMQLSMNTAIKGLKSASDFKQEQALKMSKSSILKTI